MIHDPTEHQRITELAHDLWVKRGRPVGSPEVDWERAEELLAHDSGIYPALRIEQIASEHKLDANGFERQAPLPRNVAADTTPKVFVR